MVKLHFPQIDPRAGDDELEHFVQVLCVEQPPHAEALQLLQGERVVEQAREAWDGAWVDLARLLER